MEGALGPCVDATLLSCRIKRQHQAGLWFEDEQDDVVCTMSSPFGEIWGEKGREKGKRQKGRSTGVTPGGQWVTLTSVVQT